MNFLRGCVAPKNILSDNELDNLASLTTMDRDEVDKQYQRFLSHHKNGKMTPRSFQSLLRQSCPGMSDGDLKKITKHIFRMYDTNLDGNVDFREFLITLHVMKEGSPEQNLKQIFRVFDINSDGVISLKELSKIVRDLHEKGEDILAKTAFDEMDTDHDGMIDESEFVSACLKRRKASTSIALKIVTLFVD